MRDTEATSAGEHDRQDKTVPQRPTCSATAIASVVSAVAAAFATLAYYPGVLYSDSYSRWSLAHALLEGGDRIAHVSIGPALFMAATYAVTENYAAFTLLQAFLFFFSTLLLVARLGVRGAWLFLPAAVLVVFPLFRGYAVFHESGVGGAVAVNFALLAALWRPARRGRASEVVRGAMLLAAAFTVFTFRQNAVTLLPAFALLVWRTFPSTALRLAHVGAVGAALVGALLLPSALGARGGASTTGFAWEIVGTLQRAKNPAYDHYLDYVGNTRAALAANVDDGIWNGMVAPEALPWGRLFFDPEVSARVKKDYVRLAAAEPRAFLANKWHVVSRTLGLGQPLAFVEFDENRWGQMPRFGYRDTAVRRAEFARVRDAMAPAFLRTPWLVFLAGLALLAIVKRGLVPRPPLAGTLLVFAACYYGAFLITTHGFEFRYFFPALHLVAVLALFVGASALREGVTRARAALKASGAPAAAIPPPS